MSQRKEISFEFEWKNVPGDCKVHVQLQAELVPDEKTGIPGFPETCVVQAVSPVSRHFQPTHIIVDDSCVDKFDIGMCCVGQMVQWVVRNERIPARILNAKPAIKFDVVAPRYQVSMFVINTTNKPVVFRARLFGYEMNDEEVKEIENKQQEQIDSTSVRFCKHCGR